MASSQTQVAGNEDSASKISQTQNEPIQDSDYTLSRVPAEAKQPFWEDSGNPYRQHMLRLSAGARCIPRLRHEFLGRVLGDNARISAIAGD